jgi:hypothetical protein
MLEEVLSKLGLSIGLAVIGLGQIGGQNQICPGGEGIFCWWGCMHTGCHGAVNNIDWCPMGYCDRHSCSGITENYGCDKGTPL